MTMDETVNNDNSKGLLAAVLWLILSFSAAAFWRSPIAAIIFTAVCSLIGIAGTARKPLKKEQCDSVFGGLILALFVYMLLHGEITFNSVMNAFFLPGLLSLLLVYVDSRTRDSFSEFKFGLFTLPTFSGRDIEQINEGCLVWVLTTLLSLVFCLLFGIVLTAWLYFMATKTLYSNISFDRDRISQAADRLKTGGAGAGKKLGELFEKASGKSGKSSGDESKEEDRWL